MTVAVALVGLFPYGSCHNLIRSAMAVEGGHTGSNTSYRRGAEPPTPSPDLLMISRVQHSSPLSVLFTPPLQSSSTQTKGWLSIFDSAHAAWFRFFILHCLEFFSSFFYLLS